MKMNVKKLEKSVQSRLRSDLTAYSITNCVIELVENAVDAHSTSIAIRIDFQRFNVQVIDNGTGMTEEQLKTVGKRHCTSKRHSQLKSKYFGYRGESLANLRKSCNRLLIITRATGTNNTFCKVFDSDGKSSIVRAVHRRIAKGTTIIMDNVLGNTPVRQARIIPSVEWQNIKQYIRATALMHPLISFSVEDKLKSIEILHIKRAKTTQKQFKNLYPEVAETSTMKQLVFEKGNIRMKAIVGCHMSEYKKLQFFFVNKRYIYRSNIQKCFKALLHKCFRDMKMKEALEVKSRWESVFVLNISCPENECNIFFELNKRHVEFKNHHVIKYCLVELTNQFRQMLGIDKMPSPYLGFSNKNKANPKNTFIAEELLETLKNANTVFGIPTTRGGVMRRDRYRYRYSIRKHVSTKVKQSDEEKCRSGTNKDVFAEDGIALGAAPAQYQCILHSREDETNSKKVVRTPQMSGKRGTNVNETRDYELGVRALGDAKEENVCSSSSKELFLTDTENVFDYSNNSAVQGELSTSKREKKPFIGAEDASITEKTRTNILPVEDDKVGKDFFASANANNDSLIEQRQKKEKTILREARLKFDGFLNFEFALKPTNDTFVNYFERRSTDVYNWTNDSRINKLDESLSGNYLYRVDYLENNSSKNVNNEMRKLTIGARSPHSESSQNTDCEKSNHFDSDHRTFSIGCCCSCHKIDTRKTKRVGKSGCRTYFENDARNLCCEIESSILNVERSASYFDSSSIEQTKTIRDVYPELELFLMSESRQLPFTPLLVSPYFLKSKDFCEEKNHSKGSTKISFDGIVTCGRTEANYDETSSVHLKNPVLHVLDDFSLQTLKKKMKYKQKCNLLAAAGAVDVPRGLLEANNFDNRKPVFQKGVEEVFYEIVKPYTVKNHYTLDDEGLSCLRVFPHLRRKEQSTTNFLIVPEELNCFLPFTKSDLHNIKFLAQIDRKFLLTTLDKTDTNENIIVIFDQHAVDERIRVEQLLQNYTDKYGIWISVSVNPPIYPDVTSSDLSVIHDFRARFEEKGLYFKFNAVNKRSGERFLIAVVKVPTCLHSKAMRECTASNFGLKLKELVGSLIKEMIELINTQCPVQNILPDTLHKILNYEACRGAIKFGDKLPKKVCSSLLKKISYCDQPFQCAHGRPLMIPLINFTKIDAHLRKSWSVTKRSIEKIKKSLPF